MNINNHILAIFRTILPATYWYKSPTPGTGTYAVLDTISEIGSATKDITAEPNITTKARLQCKVYSDDTTDARTQTEAIQNLIRTTVNNEFEGLTWLHAHDDRGIQSGYDARADRYYYIIDFFMYYKINATNA